MATIRKRSRKRDAILACVRATTCHPSAEWVYQRLKPTIPDLSLGTVYRNLSMFKDEGLVISVGTVGGLERFDGNTKPHTHFVCTRCSAVLGGRRHHRLPAQLLRPVPRLYAGSKCC